MENESKFKPLFNANVIYGSLLYSFFGIICSEGLHSQPNPIIFFSVQKKRKSLVILDATYAIVLICTYPVQLFNAVRIISENQKIKRISESSYPFSKYVLQFVVIILQSIFAFFIPNFNLFISLVGALGASSIMFIFPNLIYNHHFREKGSITRLQYVFNLGTSVLIGLISMVTVIFNLICTFQQSKGNT